MRGSNSLLIIVIGLIMLWAIVNGAGPCLGGALACLTKGSGRSSTTTASPLPSVITPGTAVG